MCDVYEEACFSQKDVYKWAKYGFATMSLIYKGSLWCRNTLSKEKVLEAENLPYLLNDPFIYN